MRFGSRRSPMVHPNIADSRLNLDRPPLESFVESGSLPYGWVASVPNNLCGSNQPRAQVSQCRLLELFGCATSAGVAYKTSAAFADATFCAHGGHDGKSKLSPKLPAAQRTASGASSGAFNNNFSAREFCL
jgi:hypothetical protein